MFSRFIMGTEIKVLHTKRDFVKGEENFEKPFYCKETPFEVLKELYPKFHIKKYNSIETFGTMINFNSHISGVVDYWIHGISINNFEPTNGLDVSGNLKDYKLNISIPNIGKVEDIMSGFVEKYLIRKEIIDSGSATQNYLRQLKSSKYGKQRAIEYLNERKKNPNPEKEQNLEDILDYGKVSLGEKFNLRKLEKMSRIIAKRIPTKIEPTNVVYATLRPSK